MTATAKLQAEEKRRRMFLATGFRCVRCGAPAAYLAHRIPKRQYLLAKFGPAVIHHEFNLCPVCTRPECNDSFDIQNNPMLQENLIAAIEGWNGREPSLDAIRQIIEWFKEQKE